MRVRQIISFVLVFGPMTSALAHAQEASGAWRELRELEARVGSDAGSVLERTDALREAASREADPLLHARVALLACVAEYRGGHLDRARRSCDEGNALAEQIGGAQLLAQARNSRANVAYAAGDTALAFGDYEAASRFAEATGNLSLVSRVQNNLGLIVRNSGAVLDALTHFRAALDAAEQLDDHPRIALAYLNLSDTYARLDQLDSAEDANRRAMAHARAGDLMRWRYAAYLQRASLLLSRERPAEALEVLRELEASAQLTGERRQVGRLRVLFADAYRATNQPRRARESAEEAVRIAQDMGDRWRAAQWRITQARVARDRGDGRRASELLAETERFARSGDRDALLQSTLQEKSALLGDQGRWESAFRTLQESRAIDERIRSGEASEQLALMRRTNEAQRAQRTIAELEQRSLEAEARGVTERRLRNGLLLALALGLSGALVWRNRSVRAAVAREAQQRAAGLRRATLEAIGRLTGGIAHDFNNLLTVVLGSLDMLVRDGGLDAEQRELVDDAIAATTTGAAITERLLAFARRRASAPERLDVVQHIAQNASLLGHAVGERVTFELALPESSLDVEVDRAQLTTALLNVVINARDAIDGAGTVQLTVERQDQDSESPELVRGPYACIRVRDDGRGMSDEALRQAFQPFFSTKDSSEGAGLGLSMVYGFARQSRGTVTIDRDLVRGTVVQMYLPIREDPTARAPAVPSTWEARPRGLAMVVEDQREVRVVACAFLQSLGFETLGAADAAEARSLIASGTEPRLLFVDIVMPGPTDGRQLATWAKERVPDVEILLATGFADEEDLADSPFPILRKPYRVEELSAYLSALFGDEHP
ncbi:MAG: ATP-binding protein [Myxococcota bacterium]